MQLVLIQQLNRVLPKSAATGLCLLPELRTFKIPGQILDQLHSPTTACLCVLVFTSTHDAALTVVLSWLQGCDAARQHRGD